MLSEMRAKMFRLPGLLVLALAIGALAVASCSSESTPEAPSAPAQMMQQRAQLTGTIEIDGSSTVAPITEAVAEEFRTVAPDVLVNVGISGSGGGFKRFTVGETDISDASRPIKEKEAATAAENGIEYYEFLVGLDGLSVMVNPQNDFVDCMTVEQLNMIWKPESTVSKWSDLDSSWPDRKFNLYGPGTDSGTFDYFTEEVNGEAKLSRADYTASEDDNVLVQGISGDRNALGYFGFAYYAVSADKLKLLDIDNGNGCVAPTIETIASGTYSPLSRPLFIYVNKERAQQRAELRSFVEFYMENGAQLAEEVGYVPLPQASYQKNLTILSGQQVMMEAGPKVALSGTIEIDGSSTVAPITEAVAEEFRKEQPGVLVNVSISGSGGGFNRFTVGETDISDASRAIKDKEASAAKENGFAYYAANADKLKLVAVDSGNGCVTPSLDTIAGGSYSPLSRPLFIYVNKSSLERPEVREFVRFYMLNGRTLTADVGYVPLALQSYQNNMALLK